MTTPQLSKASLELDAEGYWRLPKRTFAKAAQVTKRIPKPYPSKLLSLI
jgi:hypothetical protein